MATVGGVAPGASDKPQAGAQYRRWEVWQLPLGVGVMQNIGDTSRNHMS